MPEPNLRSLGWNPIWSPRRLGLEHLLLRPRSADSTLVVVDEDGEPWRLSYRLKWAAAWRLQEAHLVAVSRRGQRSLVLHTDGRGRWFDAGDRTIAKLDGCSDIDIWPTPFTNSFPIRRLKLRIGERQEIRVAWVSAPELTVEPKQQAYTRLATQTYRFESLDGSGFSADLDVDADGVVLDYPGLFERV